MRKNINDNGMNTIKNLVIKCNEMNSNASDINSDMFVIKSMYRQQKIALEQNY